MELTPRVFSTISFDIDKIIAVIMKLSPFIYTFILISVLSLACGKIFRTLDDSLRLSVSCTISAQKPLLLNTTFLTELGEDDDETNKEQLLLKIEFLIKHTSHLQTLRYYYLFHTSKFSKKNSFAHQIDFLSMLGVFRI